MGSSIRIAGDGKCPAAAAAAAGGAGCGCQERIAVPVMAMINNTAARRGIAAKQKILAEKPSTESPYSTGSIRRSAP